MMKELHTSLTRRANALIEARKKQVAQAILGEAVGIDAGSLKTYHEIGWNENVSPSEKHPEGVLYHKIHNISGMPDRDAYELARKEANKRGHATVLIGGATPLTVNPAEGGEETPAPAPGAPAPEVTGAPAADTGKTEVMLQKSGKRYKVGVQYDGQWLTVFMDADEAKTLARKLREMSPVVAYKYFKKHTQEKSDKDDKKVENKDVDKTNKPGPLTTSLFGFKIK